MSFFGDFSFFIYLFALLIPAVVLGVFQKPIKYYSFALSFVFIWLIYSSSRKEMVFLIFFLIFSFLIVQLYLKLRGRFERNSKIYGLVVLAAIAPLVVSKATGLFHINILGFLGISYITFKVVQIIIETYDGVIKEINAFEFFSFMLFFPTISSGPIDRSRRFTEDLDKVHSLSEYLSLLGNGAYKILLGIAYKFVFSAIVFEYLGKLFEGKTDFLSIVGYAYLYGFYMFFDFAGYSSMAVGASYILGITTPENFNKPFISIDMKEFWNRWHISLSHWFRDFVFSRFVINLIRHKWFKDRLTGASVGLIVNMLIMGVWHGITWYYIAYGLYHGILLAITEIYQKKSKFYKKHKNDLIYKIFSWLITINAVMFGFYIFSGQIGA